MSLDLKALLTSAEEVSLSLGPVRVLRLLSWRSLASSEAIVIALPEFLAVASQEANVASLALASLEFMAVASQEAFVASLPLASPEFLAVASQEAFVAGLALASPEALELASQEAVLVSVETRVGILVTWVGFEGALGVPKEGSSPEIACLAI